MHFGNVLCALVAYLSVKSRGGKFIVRIEDLDKARCNAASAERAIDILARLGMHSDEPPIYQSERSNFYGEKVDALEKAGLTYPCFCTRSELLSATAPRLSDGGVVYSGACRNLNDAQKSELYKSRKPCTRVRVPDEDIVFEDKVKGEIRQNLAQRCGDFIVRRSDGVYAYQLAVAADDGDSGVTEVVRGDDLATSAPRQIWLMKFFGYTPPTYCHIPLVCDSHGRKLSKSDGDAVSYNLLRLPKERILGALAFSAGLTDADGTATLEELIETFSWDRINRNSIRLPDILCR